MPGRVGEVDDPGVAGRGAATRSAMSTATGTVRSPYAMPPAPTVSWPSTPSSSATRSSFVRPSRPPTRIAEKTKSAPRSASSRSVVAVTPRARRRRRRLLGEHARRSRRAGRRRGRAATTSVDPPSPRVAQQRPVHERDPEPAAAENGQPHAMTTSTPASTTRLERVPGRRPSLVTSTSMSSGPQTRASPVPGNLCAVGQQHDLVARPRSWRA